MHAAPGGVLGTAEQELCPGAARRADVEPRGGLRRGPDAGTRGSEPGGQGQAEQRLRAGRTLGALASHC